MKNCICWWFPVKNFGSKSHCKNTKTMAISLFLDRQKRWQLHSHYHRKSFYAKLEWIFSVFEYWLSWEYDIFEHDHLNKSLGASDYCRPEAIVDVVELLSSFSLRFYPLWQLKTDWYCSCILSVLQIRGWHYTKSEVFHWGLF